MYQPGRRRAAFSRKQTAPPPINCLSPCVTLTISHNSSHSVTMSQKTAVYSTSVTWDVLKIFCDAARHADRRQGFLILQSNIVTLTSNIEFTDVFTFTFLKVVCQIYTFISRFIRYTLLIPFGPPLFFLTSLILCANRVLETKIRDFGSTLLQIYSTPRP